MNFRHSSMSSAIFRAGQACGETHVVLGPNPVPADTWFWWPLLILEGVQPQSGHQMEIRHKEVAGEETHGAVTWCPAGWETPRDANVKRSKRCSTLWYINEQSPSEWPTRGGQTLSWNKLLEWIWYALLSHQERHRSQAGGKRVILTSCPANEHFNIYVELHQIRSCCHSAVVSISLFPFWICSIDFTTKNK